MRRISLAAGALLALMLSNGRALADTLLYSDGFESYTDANSPLDANTAGANAAPNGGPGNPWFGPAPPNLRVVSAGGGISSGAAGPHSGTQMVTASAASDFDQDWFNLAHRLNSGSNFTGDIKLDWYFYDPSGAGDTNYRDYVALGNYATASTGAASNLDYTTASGGNLNPGGATQRLSLGASNPSGFNSNQYQARIVGATDGLANGWFNIGSRSVGWHEGTIVLADPNGSDTMVSFYIDGFDYLDHAIMNSTGVNVIELNDGFGSTVGNYDDVSFSLTPEPTSACTLAFAAVLLIGRRERRSGPHKLTRPRLD